MIYDCNWMQSLEGDIDSSHIDYLHSRLTPEAPSRTSVGFGRLCGNADRYAEPRLRYPMDYGAVYAGQRRWNAEGDYHYRIAQFLLPFYTMIPGGGPTVAFNAWVPVDDDHTVQISFKHSIKGPVPEDQRTTLADPYTRLGGYLPATSEPLTRWRSPAHRDNDYLLELREPAHGDVFGHPARRQAAGHCGDGEHGRDRGPREGAPRSLRHDDHLSCAAR